ncbi:MAG: hypothetical protein QNJ54_12930 [Prochloraceae cyanobacterium]|nr:hypothetical protein [Prochloraceae cyanobacterium]
MSNPVINAFFFGRALAEVVNEKVEELFTNALSEVGKFDAEQRENLRQFAVEVKSRAEREIEKANNQQSSTYSAGENNSTTDLQETIDELRAEIARLRAELKSYKSESS